MVNSRVPQPPISKLEKACLMAIGQEPRRVPFPSILAQVRAQQPNVSEESVRGALLRLELLGLSHGLNKDGSWRDDGWSNYNNGMDAARIMSGESLSPETWDLFFPDGSSNTSFHAKTQAEAVKWVRWFLKNELPMLGESLKGCLPKKGLPDGWRLRNHAELPPGRACTDCYYHPLCSILWGAGPESVECFFRSQRFLPKGHLEEHHGQEYPIPYFTSRQTDVLP